MKTYNQKIFNFENITIYCEGFETSYNWGHKASLFYNNNHKRDEKVIYLNRTWESYQYQSIILKTLYNEKAYYEKVLIDNYKQDNNRKRLTQQEKDNITKDNVIINDYTKAIEYFRGARL